MKNVHLYLSPTEFLLCNGGCKYFGACRAVWRLRLCRVASGEKKPSQRRKNQLKESSFCFPNCWCLKKIQTKNLKGVYGGTGAQFCCVVALAGFSNAALGARAAQCCWCLLGELKQIRLPSAKGEASAETKGCVASSAGWRSRGVLT